MSSAAVEQYLKSLLGISRLQYTKAEIVQQRFFLLSLGTDYLDPKISLRRITRVDEALPSPGNSKMKQAAKQTQARLVANRAEEEVLARDIRSALNKVCAGNMPKLLKRLFDLASSQPHGSQLLTFGIFEKACSETKYTQLYAALCQALDKAFLAAGLVDHNTHNHPISLFQKAILRNCQLLFESSTDRAETDKSKVLGNVRFIGELYKVHLLGPKVLLECTRDLIDVQLRTLKRFTISELHLREDRLEGVCLLLPIVMKTPEAAPQVHSLLKLLQKIWSDRWDISPRLKYLLLVSLYRT